MRSKIYNKAVAIVVAVFCAEFASAQEPDPRPDEPQSKFCAYEFIVEGDDDALYTFEKNFSTSSAFASADCRKLDLSGKDPKARPDKQGSIIRQSFKPGKKGLAFRCNKPDKEIVLLAANLYVESQSTLLANYAVTCPNTGCEPRWCGSYSRCIKKGTLPLTSCPVSAICQ
jgi:hypothetical protein